MNSNIIVWNGAVSLILTNKIDSSKLNEYDLHDLFNYIVNHVLNIITNSQSDDCRESSVTNAIYPYYRAKKLSSAF